MADRPLYRLEYLTECGTGRISEPPFEIGEKVQYRAIPISWLIFTLIHNSLPKTWLIR